MKKLLFLLVIITACQRDIVPIKSRSASVALTDVNIGTTANDGTGDALRTAFGKVNSNNTLIENAFATVPTVTEMRDAIADTNQYNKEQAVSLSATAWIKTDTTYTHKKIITYDQLQSALSGIEGGTATAPSSLQFIVGVTSGAPSNGDSTLYHTNLVDKNIDLYRGTTADMHFQWPNTTARNSITGYRISNDTVIVRPPFATNDRILIKYLGGTADTSTFGTNSLLTGLMGYWAMEEASGDLADSHSTNVDGTASAGLTYHQTGAITYGIDFNGTSSNVSLGTECRPTAALSVSLWFNTANITTEQMLVGNTYYAAGGWTGYRVSVASDGSITFIIGTGTATILDKSYSSGKDDGALHHVVCTWDGGNAYIYVDNVKSPASVMTTAAAYDASGTLRFGSNFDATSMFYGGIMDEVGIWSKALTDAEVAILFAKTAYPFN